ncbi:MAG: enoyl-CoA hydratase/isomerase family protein, partial [Nereida ignava]
MIDVSKQSNAVVITLNRPAKANALTQDMLQQVLAAVRSARDANCLVLTGAGSVFSAGADLDAAKAGLAISPIWEEVSAEIANFPGLTIAALNGTVAGGAMGMVLACDLRIAAPTAKFFYPVMRLGFLPQPSDPIRMSRLIGPARTNQVFMAGAKVPA